MAPKARTAPPIDPEVLKKLAQTMTPVNKNAQPVFKSTELGTVVSVSYPAMGRFAAHAVREVRECCEKRSLNSRAPQAFRVHTGQVPGIIILEPLDIFDPHATDQYVINWYSGNHRAAVNLLPVFQPLGLEVPAGHIADMFISCEQLPNAGYFLLLQTANAEIREEKKGTRKRKAANKPKESAANKPRETAANSQAPAAQAPTQTNEPAATSPEEKTN